MKSYIDTGIDGGGGKGGLYCNSNKVVGVQMKEGRVVSHRVSHGVHYRL